MKRSTQKFVQATEVETIDLTEDFDVDPGNRSTPPEEGDDTIPRIYIPSDDEDEDDDDGDEYFRELTPGASLKADIKRLVLSTNTGPAPNDIVEAAVTESGYFIEPGTDAELIFEDQEEFLRVTRLFNDSKGEIQLEGIPAVRTHAYVFHNRLLKKCNELCVVIQARADNKNRLPDVNEYLVTRPLSSVICTRKIIFNNVPFPKLSVREAWRYRTWKDAMDRGVLVCRWKSIEFLDIVKWNVPRQTYVRLRKHECDIGVPDAQLMLEWRDAKTESSDASHQNKKSKKRKAINLINEEKAAAIPDHRVHTYGDICAGAGGATTAAKRAGLQVNFALDNAADPCATLRMNFPGAKILHMEIFDFLKPEFAMKDYMRVDVLHISFPCQPYSTANTRKGKGVNDQKNKDLGLCVIELLKKIRPRIVTFEQSPNITKGENCPMFDALIHQLTAMDYSAQSQVVNLADYSNAQARKRLIIIASCPGQPLPSVPKPTHGNGPGLQPYTTIAHFLSQLPNKTEPHMTDRVVWKKERSVMPYNPNRPLRGAITCNGGDANLHPNGLRPFNLQEHALLQGFPVSHKFHGSKGSIMRQIGNAVPAKAFTPFFKEISKCLQEFDEEVVAYQNEVIGID